MIDWLVRCSNVTGDVVRATSWPSWQSRSAVPGCATSRHWNVLNWSKPIALDQLVGGNHRNVHFIMPASLRAESSARRYSPDCAPFSSQGSEQNGSGNARSPCQSRSLTSDVGISCAFYCPWFVWYWPRDRASVDHGIAVWTILPQTLIGFHRAVMSVTFKRLAMGCLIAKQAKCARHAHHRSDTQTHYGSNSCWTNWAKPVEADSSWVVTSSIRSDRLSRRKQTEKLAKRL